MAGSRPWFTLPRLMAVQATAILGVWIWAGFFADPERHEGLALLLLVGSCFGLMMLGACGLVVVAMLMSPSDPALRTVSRPMKWPRFTIGQLMLAVAIAALTFAAILWH